MKAVAGVVMNRVHATGGEYARVGQGRYAPQQLDTDWHPLFCEALQKIDYVEYLLDELISGTLEERTAIVKAKEKDLNSLEKRIAAFSGRGVSSEQGDSIPDKIRSTRFLEELAM